MDQRLLYRGNHPVVEKILLANPNSYIIFYDPNCPYSQRALALLRSNPTVSYKGYIINNIDGGMSRFLQVLNQNIELIGYDPTHRTKPVIFYQNKFLGGYDELNRLF